MKVNNINNENRKIINQLGAFSVVEYEKDSSVNIFNAQTEYFMGKMGVRRRQVLVNLNNSAIKVQAGAMQWMAGAVEAKSGVKGVGDLIAKKIKSSVTKESTVKPVYSGNGLLMLEPTYKYIILLDVASWGAGVTIEDGMFLACDNTVQEKIVARSSLSSAMLGSEGIFNLSLRGSGVAVLESNVPMDELIEIELDNDTMKIDGNLAVCWSSNLDFT
ncbi:MAG: AIM24 family protein, partial [Eubacterium sp.]|nr:AIM24 family protein [Eubacterium sp.]